MFFIDLEIKGPIQVAHFYMVFRRLISTETKGFLDKVVRENDVVVFMKGTASLPLCGFSRNVCKLLELQGIVLTYYSV